MSNPGWNDWCRKEFLHKMHQNGKLAEPNYAGTEAKNRRNNAMHSTLNRIFPDELDNMYAIGSFQRHEKSKTAKDPRRDARKKLSIQAAELAKELSNEMERTSRLEKEIRRRTTSAPHAVVSAPLGESEARSAFKASKLEELS